MELTFWIGVGLVCWGFFAGVSYTQILRCLEDKFNKKISGDYIKEDDKHD
jgi:hypothetical protein